MRSKKSATPFRIACIVLVICLLGCSGCAFLRRQFARDSSQGLPLRAPAAGAREQAFEIPRASYKAALDKGGDVNRVRLVQVFSGARDPSAEEPQWRIFDVRPGSVCELLGIRNADVILAANGHMFRDSGKFAAYLALIAAEKNAQIQLRRDGQEFVMNYVFLDPDSIESLPDNLS